MNRLNNFMSQWFVSNFFTQNFQIFGKVNFWLLKIACWNWLLKIDCWKLIAWKAVVSFSLCQEQSVKWCHTRVEAGTPPWHSRISELTLGGALKTYGGYFLKNFKIFCGKIFFEKIHLKGVSGQKIFFR